MPQPLAKVNLGARAARPLVSGGGADSWPEKVALSRSSGTIVHAEPCSASKPSASASALLGGQVALYQDSDGVAAVSSSVSRGK